MPKYMWKIRYTQDGAKGLLKDGAASRVAAATKIVESLGGTLESFYFALGDPDAYVIVDLPSNADAMAVSMTVATGGGATNETVALLTSEEADEASNKTVVYRPPGQ